MRLKKNDNTQVVKLGCLGKVKTGMKNAERGFHVSLDYFRFDSSIPTRVDKLREMYGDKPKSINITFYSDDQNEVCTQRLELRDSGGRLVAYGDGERFMVSTAAGWLEKICITDEDKTYIKDLKTKYSTSKYVANFKETLILRFLIIGFPEIGFWELRTYGKETAIPQITSVFDFCLQSFGRVKMIPFTLTVDKHKSNRAEVNRNYSVIQLFCNIAIDAIDAVRDWNGAGLLSGDKLGNLISAQKVINAPKEKEEEDVVIVEDIIDDDTEGVGSLMMEIFEGLELLNDVEEVEKYYTQLVEEHGEDVLMGLDGFKDLFEGRGMKLE